MSKLVEYKGKRLLLEKGFSIPEGVLITTGKDADSAFLRIGPGVLKAQVLTTGRAGKGLIKFPETVDELKDAIDELLECTVNGVPVKILLYERKLSIRKEFYAGVVVDKTIGAPVLVFSSRGGSGIEEIASKYPDSVFRYTINPDELPEIEKLKIGIKTAGIPYILLDTVAEQIYMLVKAAVAMEVENLEINPFILTSEGSIVAADCHLTVDDYAVFRHPEFDIEIARELGHAPTDLEKIAWKVEKNDYRGTFYFIQLEQNFNFGEGYIGFHGAGGGGSMMSMDALSKFGYKPANFCDTSGNPPASKIYRAARIILAQKNIDGYFGSGSGVASQEQFHSARGIVKALIELSSDFPVVFRLGGNGENEAIRILENYTKNIRAPVRCFGKDTSVTECAEIFDMLIKEYLVKKSSSSYEHAASADSGSNEIGENKRQDDLNFLSNYSFKTVTGGTVGFDYSRCIVCSNKVCISGCYAGILKGEKGLPVLNITSEEAAKGRCVECLVCEIECQMYGKGGGRIVLPIDGLAGGIS